jgi:hypothetical protein
VIGNDETFATFVETLQTPVVPRKPAEILAVADRLRHPDDLADKRRRDAAAMRAELASRLKPGEGGHLLRAPEPPPLGEWPEEIPGDPGLSVTYDWRAARPFPTVSIILVPTDDWTTVAAHLQWGGWNDCPPPEYHVAALRSWRDRFGAELVGLSFDVMNLRVARRPQGRPAALDLAREHYLFCNDVVDQGVGTLNALAAALATNAWWYFWWD